MGQFEKQDADFEALATTIYNQFIDVHARTPINLPGNVLQEIHDAVKNRNFSREMFAEAKRQAGMLLQDSYRRFKIQISPSWD